MSLSILPPRPAMSDYSGVDVQSDANHRTASVLVLSVSAIGLPVSPRCCGFSGRVGAALRHQEGRL